MKNAKDMVRQYERNRYAFSEFLAQGRVFVNGRLLEHGSRELQFGEIISVRGHGQFTLADSLGLSKKANTTCLSEKQKKS